MNDKGKIQFINLNTFTNNGYSFNDNVCDGIVNFGRRLYAEDVWDYRCFRVILDIVPNTWCRSPGNNHWVPTQNGGGNLEIFKALLKIKVVNDKLQFYLNVECLMYAELYLNVECLMYAECQKLSNQVCKACCKKRNDKALTFCNIK